MPERLPSHLANLLQASTSDRDDAWSSFVAHYSRLIMSVARTNIVQYDEGMDRYAFILEHLRRDDFQKLRSYTADPRCKFTTWLVVVCRRMCIDCHRQKYGRTRAGADVIRLQARRSLADSLIASTELEAVAAPASERPDEQVEARDVAQRLEHCLARLDAGDRLLIKLRFEDDLAAPEIARILRLPTVFHVYRRINRILADLRVVMMAAPVASHQKPSSLPLHTS